MTSDVLFPVEQQRELANVLIQSGRWRGGEVSAWLVLSN